MFLGIDIGCSGVKAVIVDECGTIAGQGITALTVWRPTRSGPSRITAWVTATYQAVRLSEYAGRRQIASPV